MASEETLRQHVRDVQADLDKDKKIARSRKHANKEHTAFLKLPINSKVEFWCDACQIDIVAPAYKVWIRRHWVGAWHSVCPDCGRMVYRHISSKKFDPYFNKSQKVRMMRSKGAKDMLRPGQYGFRTLYGDPFEEYYMKFQKREEDLTNKYAAIGIKGYTADRKNEQQRIRDTINP